ncbi:YdcF family protein [Rubripirellula sp.]|nr:YdcF family protein [Rubripirellula sp.]
MRQATSRYLRKTIFILICALLLCFLSSFRQPRTWFAHPLYMHEPSAKAPVAYVMSGGPASFERLLAASDLYHSKQILKVAILEETQHSTYNYAKHQSENRTERCIAYLEMRGVPREKIMIVPEFPLSRFGSLREARCVARQLPNEESLVVITSAAHTRRTYLAFKRSMPQNTHVMVHAASSLLDSDEIFSPIWLEYAKLLTYFLIA